ncbi:1-acyl-sn-glycerol-3-phosphate acyltransferase beta-like isoform X2 [Periplaneta americana]
MAMLSGGGMTELFAAAILLLVFLYHVSNVFRYYFKFTVFIITSLGCASIFIPLMLWRPRSYKNALIPAWCERQLAKLLLGLTFEVRGHENIVQDSGSVVLINHQSALDIIVLAEIWPVMERCTVISKKEIFYLWPFGLACWLWGTIFIDRLNVEKAQNTINSTGDTIRRKKARLCMFPEGTRNSSATLLPFKKGAFHVAIASQTPIQPIVVSRYYFLDDRKKLFNPGHSIINILPAIPTAGLTKNDVAMLIDKTHSAMSEASMKTTEQVLAHTATPVANGKKCN